jgi:NAD-dependent dihydropyrimidine dehydrogenase PreA subunit
MSTEIYYFSGTGNSLHVARELQKRIPEAKLIPIVSLVSKESVRTNGKTAGFVFPHYASSLPKIVHTFIERLDLGSARYLFAIATRGRTQTMAFVEIDKILKEKGKRLDSYFVFTMPSGSEPLVKGYASRITEERILRLESEMLARLDSIHKTIVNQEISREEDTGDGTPPPPLLVPFLPLIRVVAPLLVPLGKLVETRFEFYYDEKCTGCGVCEKVCLAEKVQMVDGKPVWQEAVKCHGCFACLNFCPEESIQVKSTWYLKSYTDQNGRYHHPGITAMDIAGQKTMVAS